MCADSRVRGLTFHVVPGGIATDSPNFLGELAVMIGLERAASPEAAAAASAALRFNCCLSWLACRFWYFRSGGALLFRVVLLTDSPLLAALGPPASTVRLILLLNPCVLFLSKT